MGDSSTQQFHFIGVCGTAMGAVAAALHARGHQVTGSDAKVYDPMKSFLASSGVSVTEGYDEKNLPTDPDALVVIGNAISRGNPECEATLNHRLLYTSLPELLKNYFLRGKRNYVVTGTHGKTTTTSLLAWLLENASRQPNFLIGGIPANLKVGARFAADADFTVLEGDEYDTAFFDKRSKFVHYLPEVVIVNNIEFDHADIYENLDAIQLSFSRLLRIVPGNGLVLANGDDENVRAVTENCPAPVQTVGLGAHCDHRISEIALSGAHTTFLFNGTRFNITLDGEFNVRNAAMSIAAARHAGLSDEEIQAGLVSFQSVARRQEVRGYTAGGIKIIDDFGHHPTAIAQTTQSLRERHLTADSGGRLWAIFEPRSNTTRRKVFQQDLVDALGHSDGAIVSHVPDVDKVPLEQRLDPHQLVADVTAQKGIPCYLEADADAIVRRLIPLVKPQDVIAVFSNGGFDGIHHKLLTQLP